MNAKLRATLKAWGFEERTKAVKAMLAAVEGGNIPQARTILKQSPLLDYFVPLQTDWWSHLAAAAGQWEMVMIVATLQSLQSKDAFAAINAVKDCRIGIEMTNSGQAKFWRPYRG